MENPFVETRRPEPFFDKEEGPKRMFDTPEKVEFIKEKTKKLIERVLKTKPAYVIFMDNSARPVSWMMRAAWKTFAGDAPMPKMKFVSIGTEKTTYGTYLSPEELIRQLDPEIFKEYWERVGPELERLDETNRKRYQDAVKRVPVMVVDEMTLTGESLELASGFFRTMLKHTPCEGYAFSDENDVQRVFHSNSVPWRSYPGAYVTDPAADYRAGGMGIMSQALRNDSETRKKGIALQKEIQGMFASDSGQRIAKKAA